MNILQKLTDEFSLKPWQVENTVKLIDDGNTIPFIARYRKEVTGALNDEQLRNLDERLKYLVKRSDILNCCAFCVFFVCMSYLSSQYGGAKR